MSLATIEKDNAVNISFIRMPDDKDNKIMESNLKRRVEKTSIYYGKYLFPIFEALTNSFQAIEEFRVSTNNEKYKGEIRITIEYTQKADTLLPAPKNVIIEDNGVGFHSETFKAFKELDTAYKPTGKGIGRVTWLKQFEKVEIESHFLDKKDTYKKREFGFNIKEAVSGGDRLSDSELKTNKTKISLLNMGQDSEPHYKDIEKIANEIIQHSLHYFKRPNCPNVVIIDSNSGKDIDLNKYLYKKIINHNYEFEVDIKNSTEKVKPIQVDVFEFKDINNPISLLLCGDDRAVAAKKLEDFLPDFNGLKKVRSCKNDSEITLIVYISHPYLDKVLNETRTEFIEQKKDDDDSENLFGKKKISIELIQENVVEALKEKLAIYTKEVKEKKKKDIDNYINHVQPHYKILIDQISDLYDKIKPGLSDSELDTELYKFYYSLEYSIRKEAGNFSKYLSNPDYTEKLSSLQGKIKALGTSKLANYILHRKVIIGMLSQYLQTDEKGNYYSEATIHNLIYPQWMDNTEVVYNDHNLWLIDDRLSFYKHIRSEETVVKKDGTDRHDISFYNKVYPYSEGSDRLTPNSIVLVEFKKPGRDDYTLNDNPIQQVEEYIGAMRKNEYKVKGQHYKITKNTPFFGYIICDVQPKGKMQELLDYNYSRFKPTPDLEGWVYADGSERIEIIPYNKLLMDAERKHFAFFKELGIENAEFVLSA